MKTLKSSPNGITSPSTPAGPGGAHAASESSLPSTPASPPAAAGGGPGMPTVIGVAAPLAAGVFAALGVSGNLLARMVRNDPDATRMIMIFSILSLIALAVTVVVPRIPRWATLIPLATLALTLCFAADTAADSQSERENPSITLSLARSDTGTLTVTAKAAGSSLRSKDRMLMRVTAIVRPVGTVEIPNPDPNHAPDDKTSSELRFITNRECKRPEPQPFNPADARLLSWTETGPNTSGDAATEQTMPVSDDARYICAWATLNNGTDPDTRQSIAILDLLGVRKP